MTVRKLSSDWCIGLLPPINGRETTSLRIGIHCHIFHVELADELLNCVELCPYDYGLVITTSSTEKMVALQAILETRNIKKVSIRIAENRGRDVGPRLFACRDMYDDFDLLLFLHTKNTEALDGAHEWRQWLLSNSCGSREIYRSVVNMFEADPKLGVVFPQSYPPIRKYMGWDGMYPQAKAFCRRMGIRIGRIRVLDFPAGSMYWARSKALQPLLQLDLRPSDFPPEAGQTNSTLAHVIERVILHVCEKSGHGWLKVIGHPEPFAGSVFVPSNLQELRDYQRKFTVRLLR